MFLAGGALVMTWVTLQAAVDVAASPDFAGGLRLVIEAIASWALAWAAWSRLRPRRARTGPSGHGPTSREPMSRRARPGEDAGDRDAAPPS